MMILEGRIVNINSIKTLRFLSVYLKRIGLELGIIVAGDYSLWFTIKGEEEDIRLFEDRLNTTDNEYIRRHNEYCIVVANSKQILIKQATELNEEGWKLAGNAISICDSYNIEHFQFMVWQITLSSEREIYNVR